MDQAHVQTSGWYISGEIKLALTLRLLAGGDTLNLGVLFDLSSNYCKEIINMVLLNWIIKPNIGDMDIKHNYQTHLN